MKIRVIAAFVLAIALAAYGCGYSTKGGLLPSHLKGIYIEPFLNKIDITAEVSERSRYRLYRPHLETDITNEVRKRFIYDGSLKVVSRDKADCVLKGGLVSYQRSPLRYASDDSVEEYRVEIAVELAFEDLHNEKSGWKESSFIGYDTYFATGAQVSTESSSLTSAVEDLARRIVERAVEIW